MAPTLQTRQLGKNGPQVTALGLGLMGLSAFYGPPKPQAERLAFLDAAYDAGQRNWDTADMYADSEDLLGEWFRLNPGKRENIFLATKFANRVLDDGSRTVDSSPEYTISACNKSLQRLGLPNVDLYYIHRLDKDTPVEKTMEALVQLKNEGKFKYIGISECSAAALRRAHAVHPISALQIEYSPMTLDIESSQINLLATARELGIATVAYSPVGRGFLTGTFTSPDQFPEGDFRSMAPRYSKENFHKNLELVRKIQDLAAKKNISAAQLALAWLLKQGEDIIPIPGTTKIERLHENLAALNVQLSDAENKQMREWCEGAEIAGGRYPPAFASALFADSPPLKA